MKPLLAVTVAFFHTLTPVATVVVTPLLGTSRSLPVVLAQTHFFDTHPVVAAVVDTFRLTAILALVVHLALALGAVAGQDASAVVWTHAVVRTRTH